MRFWEITRHLLWQTKPALNRKTKGLYKNSKYLETSLEYNRKTISLEIYFTTLLYKRLCNEKYVWGNSVPHNSFFTMWALKHYFRPWICNFKMFLSACPWSPTKFRSIYTFIGHWQLSCEHKVDIQVYLLGSSFLFTHPKYHWWNIGNFLSYLWPPYNFKSIYRSPLTCSVRRRKVSLHLQ